mmetsp:Transcript_19469/g.44752  ORF Transcript_19469/g.44752 Transcript_19469/m.44752 type:complete len:87 (+) Transcript_19469:531-791(+)
MIARVANDEVTVDSPADAFRMPQSPILTCESALSRPAECLNFAPFNIVNIPNTNVVLIAVNNRQVVVVEDYAPRCWSAWCIPSSER